VRNSGAADRVRFLGAVDQTVSSTLTGSPICSTAEGFGIAFVEAMACGTPALGLDVAGARDALADGELGILVSEADFVGALDRALSGLRPDPQMLAAKAAARFGRGAFVAHISRIFAWDSRAFAATLGPLCAGGAATVE
jgi:phosphatidyl-myo-inositol dimannoside synthase